MQIGHQMPETRTSK